MMEAEKIDEFAQKVKNKELNAERVIQEKD